MGDDWYFLCGKKERKKLQEKKVPEINENIFLRMQFLSIFANK